ncbi:MAG: HlyD family efflux transporter periplasmic adaptor subunit [archaeon]
MMNKYVNFKTLIIVTLVFFIFISIFIYFNFYKKEEEFIEVQTGWLEKKHKTEAIILREEKIHKSPFSGEVMSFVKEGKKIPGNKQIISIKNSNENVKKIYSDTGMLISFKSDGLEKEMTENNFNNIAKDDFKKFSTKENTKKIIDEEEKIKKGEPLYREINNNYLFLAIKNSNKYDYTKGEMININIDSLNSNIKGRVIKINNEENLILVRLNTFIDEWINKRKTSIKILEQEEKGFIIPKTAIIKHEDEKGVLIKKAYQDQKDLSFVSVDILLEKGNKLVVDGLTIGDYIAKNPKKQNYEIKKP